MAHFAPDVPAVDVFLKSPGAANSAGWQTARSITPSARTAVSPCQSVASPVYTALPVSPPWWAVLAATATALGTGILFSVWPARRAARLDPVAALRQE